MNAEDRLFEIKSFLNDPVKNEQLSFILVAHILLEKYIDEIIETVLPKGEIITKKKSSRLYLLDKVDILRSVDRMPNITYQLFKEFNKIRNKFSHEFQYQITDTDVEEMGKHIEKDMFERINSTDWNNFDKIKPLIYVLFGNVAKILEYKEKIKIKTK